MKAWIISFLLIPAASWAQSAIAPPQLGFVKDGAGALRPAYGVAGDFVLGPAVAGNVADAAFSGSLRLLKTDTSLAAFDAQGNMLAWMEVGAGPALFAFSADGRAALAYLVSSKELMELCGGRFAPIPLDPVPADTVMAIAFPSGTEAVFIVERARGLWEQHISIDGGGVLAQNALPGIHAPVLRFATGGLLYSDRDGLAIRRPDGSEARVAASLPQKFALQQMTQDWVEVVDGNSRARFAVRVALGREGFYRLPEESQEQSRAQSREQSK